MRIALLLPLLAGCITTQPDAIRISVPVAVPCITADQLPAAPVAKSDAELAKLSDGQLVLAIAADRLEYRRYSNEAGAVMGACIKP